MMLNEHPTPTPKSLQQAEVKKFCTGNSMSACLRCESSRETPTDLRLDLFLAEAVLSKKILHTER